ncbi:FUSC family protein [Xanthobacteraceae bacterium A53D]
MRSFRFNVKTFDTTMLTVTAEDAIAAVRVGLSVGLPLFALYAADQLHFAVYAAFGALTSLYGHSETARRRAESQLVVGLCMVATIAVGALYAALSGPTFVLGILLFAVVVGTGTLGAVMGWVPRGEIFFILVLLVIAGIPIRLDQLPYALAAGAGGAALSVGLTLASPRRERWAWAQDLRSRMREGSASLDPAQHAVIILAAAIGAVAAWILAQLLSIGHPFWAPIAVAALMPALTSDDAIRRTCQLLLGTAAGVGFAALLFAGEPGPLALICLIAVCQAIAELFVARNYALALVFITPLAIGMSNLGRGLAWNPLLIERLLEAGVGMSVALVAIAVGRLILARMPVRAAAAEVSKGAS